MTPPRPGPLSPPPVPDEQPPPTRTTTTAAGQPGGVLWLRQAVEAPRAVTLADGSAAVARPIRAVPVGWARGLTTRPDHEPGEG